MDRKREVLLFIYFFYFFQPVLSLPIESFSFGWSSQRLLCSLTSVIKQSAWTARFFLLARGRAFATDSFSEESCSASKKENDYFNLQTPLFPPPSHCLSEKHPYRITLPGWHFFFQLFSFFFFPAVSASCRVFFFFFL